MTDADLQRQLEQTLSDYLAPLSVTKDIFGWAIYAPAGYKIGHLWHIGKNWRLQLPSKGIDINLEFRDMWYRYPVA